MNPSICAYRKLACDMHGYKNESKLLVKSVALTYSISL